MSLVDAFVVALITLGVGAFWGVIGACLRFVLPLTVLLSASTCCLSVAWYLGML